MNSEENRLPLERDVVEVTGAEQAVLRRADALDPRMETAAWLSEDGLHTGSVRPA